MQPGSGGRFNVAELPFEPVALTLKPPQRPSGTDSISIPNVPARVATVLRFHVADAVVTVTRTRSFARKCDPLTTSGRSDASWSAGRVAADATPARIRTPTTTAAAFAIHIRMPRDGADCWIVEPQ